MFFLKNGKNIIGTLLLTVLVACSTTRPVDFYADNNMEKPIARIKLLQPQLKRGEWLAFRYQVSRAGFVNVYAVNRSGSTMQLVRNQQINKPGWHAFPSASDRFDVRVSGPTGTERFILVYTEQPFNPILQKEFKGRGRASDLTLTSGQLQHRLDQATRSLRSDRWARADTTLRID